MHKFCIWNALKKSFCEGSSNVSVFDSILKIFSTNFLSLIILRVYYNSSESKTHLVPSPSRQAYFCFYSWPRRRLTANGVVSCSRSLVFFVLFAIVFRCLDQIHTNTSMNARYFTSIRLAIIPVLGISFHLGPFN